MEWLNIQASAPTLEQFISRLMNLKSRIYLREIAYVSFNALVYHLWQMRNQAMFHNQQHNIEHTVNYIKTYIGYRILLLAKGSRQYRKCIDTVLR